MDGVTLLFFGLVAFGGLLIAVALLIPLFVINRLTRLYRAVWALYLVAAATTVIAALVTVFSAEPKNVQVTGPIDAFPQFKPQILKRGCAFFALIWINVYCLSFGRPKSNVPPK